jgi:hypothetical protein
MGQKDVTGRSGKAEKDGEGGKTTSIGQNCLDSITRIGLPVQDSQNRTARIGYS